MITSDLELYNILKEFYYNDFGDVLPVFRDRASDKTKPTYIIYSSVNSDRIYASGEVIANLTEFEIVLVQKNQNDVDLKKLFVEYLTFSGVKISSQAETTSIEDVDEYYFLTMYTQILIT